MEGHRDRRWRSSLHLAILHVIVVFLHIQGSFSSRSVFENQKESPPSPDDQFLPIRINCGATRVVIVDGVRWDADAFFPAVSYVGAILSVGNAHPLSLYREFRSDASDRFYSIPVKPFNYYLVRLWFAAVQKESLSFNVSVSGVVVGEVGHGTRQRFSGGSFIAATEEYSLFVSEPILRIGVHTSSQLHFGRINAIEVLKIGDGVNPFLHRNGGLGKDVILHSEGRLNCGGPAIAPNDTYVFRWQGEEGFFSLEAGDGGILPSAMLSVDDVEGKMNESGWVPSEVWRTARVSTGNLVYTFPVRPAVQYYILIHVGGIVNANFAWDGEEIVDMFDIFLDGILYRQGFDPRNQSIPYLLRPEVTAAGNKSVKLRAVRGVAYINGIEVYGEIPLTGRTDPSDAAAFLAIENALFGRDMRGWDPCLSPLVDGYVCNYSYAGPPTIQGVNFTGLGLLGGLPPALGRLQNLEQLLLGSNQLNGEIPPELALLSAVRIIDLSNNSLSGEIPTWLAQLPALKSLHLDMNDFKGEVPSVLVEKLGSNFTYADNPQLCTSPGCANRQPISFGTGLPGQTPVDGVTASTYGPAQASKEEMPADDGNLSGKVGQHRLDLLESGAVKFDQKQNDRQVSAVVVGVTILAGLTSMMVLAASAIACLWSRDSSSSVKNKNSGQNSARTTTSVVDSRANILQIERSRFDPQGPVRRFEYREIKKATANFSVAIGDGGEGHVYKGQLAEGGPPVAVKVRSNIFGVPPTEFEKEVEVLSGVRHKNLVKLIGYCTEKKVQAIILEYLPNGSLFDYLHGRKRDCELSWEQRLKIALGAAYGIEYLHTQVSQVIIHRNIKSANILLDEKLDAKVTDFTLAKAVNEDGTFVQTTTEVKGTTGYLDPEYFETLQLKDKSDVYSFGIVLLEILTGRQASFRNPTGGMIAVSDWARPHLINMELESIVDPRLRSEPLDLDSMWAIADLAMVCSEPFGCNRPAIGRVARAIEDAIKVNSRRSKQ